jgi:hypothetical protein
MPYALEAKEDVQFLIDTERFAFDVEGRNRCGINALYLGLKFFDKKRTYHELIDSFPNVREKGISMTQIKSFLEKEGFHCKSIKTTQKKLFSINKNVAVFVLAENAAQKNNSISHLYFATVLSTDELKIFDFPHFIGSVRKSNSDDTEVFCLLASPNPGDLLEEGGRVFFLIGSLCLIALCFLFSKCRKYYATILKLK